MSDFCLYLTTSFHKSDWEITSEAGPESHDVPDSARDRVFQAALSGVHPLVQQIREEDDARLYGRLLFRLFLIHGARRMLRRLFR